MNVRTILLLLPALLCAMSAEALAQYASTKNFIVKASTEAAACKTATDAAMAFGAGKWKTEASTCECVTGTAWVNATNRARGNGPIECRVIGLYQTENPFFLPSD